MLLLLQLLQLLLPDIVRANCWPVLLLLQLLLLLLPDIAWT